MYLTFLHDVNPLQTTRSLSLWWRKSIVTAHTCRAGRPHARLIHHTARRRKAYHASRSLKSSKEDNWESDNKNQEPDVAMTEVSSGPMEGGQGRLPGGSAIQAETERENGQLRPTSGPPHLGREVLTLGGLGRTRAGALLPRAGSPPPAGVSYETPWTFSARCSLFRGRSRCVFSLMLTHVGSGRGKPAGPCPGTAQEPWPAGCAQPGFCLRTPHGQADEARPAHSPETVGVGLAQDTVIRGGQRVEPEVGKALAGVRR